MLLYLKISLLKDLDIIKGSPSQFGLNFSKRGINKEFIFFLVPLKEDKVSSIFS